MALITNKSYVDKDVMLYGTGTYDTTTTPSNEVKIKESGGGADTDYFGYCVAVGSGRIVVGSPYDDSVLVNSGSAYIFDLNGTQLAKIKASDPLSDSRFAETIAVGCGRIVVGAYTDDDLGSGSGSAYVYNLNGTQLVKIKASDGVASDYFGRSVAVGSGRIVVGAYGDDDLGSISGSAYIFDLSGNQLAKIKASDGATDDFFGLSIAAGCGRIVVGSPYDDDIASSSGSAYIFDLNGNQLAKIKASDAAEGDNFGYSVAVGSGRIVVGSPYDDDIASGSGSAYIFDLNGNQLAKIKASDAAEGDNFGDSVAVGSGRIVVGAYGDDDLGNSSGSAYVFNLDGTQLAKIKASDGAAGDYFGDSVAVGSGRIVVGAFLDDDSQPNSGSAYVYNTPNQPHILDILDNK